MQPHSSSTGPTALAARKGSGSDDPFPLNLTPAQLLCLIIMWVFAGETASMLLVYFLPPMAWVMMALLDATILILILSPAYFALYRPLKLHYAERQRAEQEVAFLSRHVMRAVEEEKKRIAHELHDECGQVLTAMQFGIESLKISVAPSVPSAIEQCDRLSSMTAQLANEVRSLTGRLRPAMLENGGLIPALRWHVDQLQGVRPELQIDLKIGGCVERLSPDIEITIYRLCQEGLNNIFRHANASQASVSLSCDEKILLRIEDNGCGFDPSQRHSPEAGQRGYGLLGMRERVADLGGKLSIYTARGKGTIVEAELPLAVQGGYR